LKTSKAYKSNYLRLKQKNREYYYNLNKAQTLLRYKDKVIAELRGKLDELKKEKVATV